MEVTDKNLYRFGTSRGKCESLLPRNAFAVSKEKFLHVDQVPDKLVTLRGLASASSMSGGT